MDPHLAFFTFSGIVNFTTSLLLGALLIKVSYQKKVNRYFSYFCFCVAAWSLFYFIWLLTPDKIMGEYYLRTCMLFVLLVPAVFFHFCVQFLKRDIPTGFIVFNYVFAMAAMSIVYTPLYGYGYEPYLGVPWLHAGPLFIIILIHFAIASGYALFLLYKQYQAEPPGRQRDLIWLVFISFFITFSGGSTNYFMWYRIPIAPYLNILVSAYVGIITYGMLKHQLLEVKIVIKNSLVYSIVISTITFVFFGLIYFTEQWLKGAIGYKSTIASLGTAMIVAVFFIPFRDFIQSIVEKYFFKGTYTQVAEQNERLRRQIIISERYKTFAEITKSVTTAIRDPLTVLKTYSFHLPKHTNGDEFLEKLNAVMAREVQKIQDLTDGLSKYSSPEPLSLQRTQIYALLSEVIDSLAHQLVGKKIMVQRDFQVQDSCWLHVDPKQMQQVIANIILHAFKTMPLGGQLFIGTDKQEDKFSIYIKDTGTAISKEDLERIFDPLYRYQEDNAGLDLAIAVSIIESHGGKITVESKKDSGNEFIIQLPLEKETV